MLVFLQNNIANILIVLALAAVVFLIVLSMRKNKKKGKTACGCGCSSCPMASECHSAKNNLNNQYLYDMP